MSIYSTNRSGSMVGIQFNPGNYKSVDIGRIMYESACNDQMMFEAIIGHDFRELNAIREGTMLQSEIAALNEASVKEFAQKARERIMKFWEEKLKPAFKNAIRMISAYVLRDGKAFASRFEDFAKGYNGKVVSVKGPVRTDVKVTIPSAKDMESYIRKNMNDERKTQKDYTHALLAKAAGYDDAMSPAEYRKKMIERCFQTDGTLKSNDVEKQLDILKNASDVVKQLTTYQKAAEVNIRETANRIKAAEKSDNKDAVRTISILVSACESVLSVTTSTAIKVVKLDVSNSRKMLGKMMSEMRGENSTVGEAAALADEAEVETELDDDLGIEPTEAEAEEIDSLVSAEECNK